MTENIKIDFLAKDELSYELMCRGVGFQENETVQRMRKLLRDAIKNNLKYSVSNLQGKINLPNELELIRNKVSQLENIIQELKDESRVQDIVRCENKLYHLKSRVENLLKCKIDEATKTVLNSDIDLLDKLILHLTSLNVQSELKERCIRKLSDSNIEEEMNLDKMDSLLEGEEEVFRSNKMASKEVMSVNAPSVNVQAELGPVNSPFNHKLYNKLPNPVEKYLCNIKHTDGLNVADLLTFINGMLKMKRELQLSDVDIFELLLTHCSGPLLDLVLSAKSRSLSMYDLNSEILNTFIPHNLRDNLKMKYVSRPQISNEPMSLYINSVKEHAEILQCNLSEEELVNNIKIGLNPECRAKLVFFPDPKTVSDLNKMCVHLNNVCYGDYVRNNNEQLKNVHPRGLNQNKPFYPAQQRCFNCGKIGHLARNCFKPRNVSTSASVPKNY